MNFIKELQNTRHILTAVENEMNRLQAENRNLKIIAYRLMKENKGKIWTGNLSESEVENITSATFSINDENEVVIIQPLEPVNSL